MRLQGFNTFSIGYGVKFCSFYTPPEAQVNGHLQSSPEPSDFDAHREVFTKTLGFFCAVVENGCLFERQDPSNSPNLGSNIEDVVDFDFDGEKSSIVVSYQILLDGRSRLNTSDHCNGKMILLRDEFRQPFIQ